MFRSMLSKMNPNRLLKPNNPTALPIYQQFFRNLAGQASELLENDGGAKATATTTTLKPAIEENPYFSKYADKIKKAQQNGGGQKVQVEEVKKVEPEKPLPSSSTKESEAPKPKVGVSKDAKRSLDNIVKLDLLKDKSTEEIIDIWRDYHSKKDCIFATIPTDKYDIMHANIRLYPNFVLPLPRDSGGYEFFVLEFQEHCCYFTPLAAYHAHSDMAPVCLSIYHYPELRAKNIVLMRGEFDTNRLNIIECQCLANQLQYYYTSDDPTVKLSLHLFNKDSKNFDHMRLIEHLEKNVLATTRPASADLDKQD